MIVVLNAQDGEKEHYPEDRVVIDAIVSGQEAETYILKNFFSYATQYAKAYCNLNTLNCIQRNGILFLLM